MPPPILPGIQDKNSNPLMLFSFANSDKFLSITPLPATIVVSSNKDILEKFLFNFITVPSYISSLNKTFEPAPITKKFPLLFIFKNLIKS